MHIDENVEFTPATAKTLDRALPPVQRADPGIPIWIWLALGSAALLLLVLSLRLWTLSRRQQSAPSAA